MRWRPGAFLAAAYLAVAYLFILLPVLALVLFPFQGSAVPVPPFIGPSLRWYGAVLADGKLLAGLANSLLVGVLSSLLALALGFLAAHGPARHRLPGGRLVEALILAPLTVSYLIIGLDLLATFNALGVER